MKNRYQQLNQMCSLIKEMHKKFGINYEGEPRVLTPEEKKFRFEGMKEEVNEFFDSNDIEEQFDALIDNAVFTLGTAERMGLLNAFEEGFHRVMEANMKKELGPNNKRGSFSIDLRKPIGWIAPNHSDLVVPKQKVKGLIVLDGPDASGKSTLAEKIKKVVPETEIIHLTWSKELEQVMDTYQLGLLHHAISLSKEKLVVIDRLWISEMIYSHVFRSGTKYPSLWHECVQLLDSAKAINILCLPEKHEWTKNYQNMVMTRDEMYGMDERMLDVYNAYADLYFGTNHEKYQGILSELIKSSPLRLLQNYVLYDFTVHNADLLIFDLKISRV